MLITRQNVYPSQKKKFRLMKYEGIDEYLQLLGYEPDSNSSFWICPDDQPPLSVIASAVQVCNEYIVQCTKRRHAVEAIKMFSVDFRRTQLKSPKNKKIKKKKKFPVNDDKSVRDRTFTEVPSSGLAISATGTVKSNTEPTVQSSKSSQQAPPQITPSHTPENTVDLVLLIFFFFFLDVYTQEKEVLVLPSLPDDDDVTKTGPGDNEWNVPDLPEPSVASTPTPSTPTRSNADPEGSNFEDDLEAEQDRFQLSELIWGITHEDNKDDSAKDVLLLCHQSFCTSMELWQCLAKRFLNRNLSRGSMSFSLSRNEDPPFYAGEEPVQEEPQKKNKDKKIIEIDASWSVQVKVTSLLQHWMRLYWEEDFATQPDLIRSVSKFIELVDYNVNNDDRFDEEARKKNKKLLQMIQQTIETQDKQHQKKAFERESRIIFSKAKSVKMLGMDQDAQQLLQGFVKINNGQFAEQLTLLDFELFKLIKPRECIGQVCLF
ncbi:hypothetical protein RFI_28054, partial [Reticulomyxa filosa]